MPVRQLCEAIAEVLNNISPNTNIIIGDFNTNWLVETDRRPLYNLLVRDKHYKQLISTYTTHNNTVTDHIYTNISNIDIQAGVGGRGFSTDDTTYILHRILNRKRFKEQHMLQSVSTRKKANSLLSCDQILMTSCYMVRIVQHK